MRERVPLRIAYHKEKRKQMNRILSLLLAACMAAGAWGQQSQELQRTQSIFAFPTFQEAKVLQSFGRFTKARVNILLKNSTLCFLDSTTVKEAYVSGVTGVQFDSVRYMKIGEKQMARVVAQKGYNFLLCVTTIDQKRLKAETEGGDNLPFLEIPDAGFFYEIDGQTFTFKQGYPLQKKYYFNLKGTVVPANETVIKKHVREEMRTAFRNLMGDRFWSWNDEASLTQLFTYFPD